MLTIAAEGTAVVVTLVFLGWSHHFRKECGSEWAAQLLARSIHDARYKNMQRAREEAYRQGWKDARSRKTAKLTWWSGEES